MELSIRKIGESIIELTAKTTQSSITEDICSRNGAVDVELIETLKDIAVELEAHNKKLKQ